MAPADFPQFQTPAGTVIGRRDGLVVRATGIRYARAGRFQPPVPEPAASSPIMATAPAPACPQVADARLDEVLGDLYQALSFSEDCLRLSVTLPADAGPTGAWSSFSSDLSAYAGQTVTLSFSAVNGTKNPTTFYLDDVSLATS